MSESTVTLVMPVRNEVDMIGSCLESVMAQDYEQILEVIVVDGASNDGTLEIIREYSSKWPQLTVLDNPKKIQTRGLNMAIRNARGDIIIRLDAHAEYAHDYVSQCVHALEQGDAACVGGGVNLLKETGYWPTVFGFVQEHPFGTGVARFRRTAYEGYVDTVWPGAYKREVFERIGLFREALTRTEDLDLHARMRGYGYKIWQTPAIKPYYRPRNTIRALVRQYFGNGEQVIETLIVNRSAVSIRHLIPFLWITLLGLVTILSLITMPGKMVLFFCLGLYILLCIVSALNIGLRNGWRYLLVVPWLFPIIHGSYGIGSYRGVLKVVFGGSKQEETYKNVIPTLG